MLCKDDTLVATPSSKLSDEQKISQRFKCRDRSVTPTGFTAPDFSVSDTHASVSHAAYVNNILPESSK